MGIAGGPNLNQDGLVFLYDVFDQDNSYKGEPTENILYSGGDTELNDGYTWTNSGTWTYSNDDTSVAKPYIPNVNTNSLLIMSGVTETVGSQQIGCAYYASLTPSTTYTISVWFRQNRAGSNQPYFRANINNNSLGNFSYNGDTDASNWPINQWIRISATATIQSNENGAYLSNYIGSAVGDKVWYFAPQLEAKSHMTPVTTVVRSATQGLLPLVGNSSIDLTNVSFDANAQILFDGTNDSMVVSNNSALKNNNTSIELVIKYLNTPAGDIIQFGVGSGTYAQYYYRAYSGYSFWNWYPVGTGYGEIAIPNGALPLNTYHHIVMTGNDQGYVQFYINGIAQTGATRTSNTQPSNWTPADLTIGGFSWDGYSSSIIPSVKIYNRVLSAQEVLQNYNATKSRFGLK
jgi:hypothetical protein